MRLGHPKYNMKLAWVGLIVVISMVMLLFTGCQPSSNEEADNNTVRVGDYVILKGDSND